MNRIVSASHSGAVTISRCTAQRKNGEFCDAPSVEDAPFPICVKHAARIVEFARELVNSMPEGEQITAMIAGLRQEQAGRAEGATPPKHADVVYYIRVGGSIKIGTTTNLPSRIKAFGPSEFLACEPGSTVTETRRHRQFSASLVAGREWFSPTPDLMAHIEHVRETHPQPRRTSAGRPRPTR